MSNRRFINGACQAGLAIDIFPSLKVHNFIVNIGKTSDLETPNNTSYDVNDLLKPTEFRESVKAIESIQER